MDNDYRKANEKFVLICSVEGSSIDLFNVRISSTKQRMNSALADFIKTVTEEDKDGLGKSKQEEAERVVK